MKKRKNSELTIEFKRAAVALMAPGVKVSALARELGVCRQRLYEWAMINCGGRGVRSGALSRRPKPTI
jgi:transposase-like protein